MKLSYRISGYDVRNTDISATLLPLIREYPECFDEITFFTDLCEHGYESMESIRENAERLKTILALVRSAGVKSVGLNILNTIGQNNEAWDWVEKSPFQTVVGCDGAASMGTNCMEDEVFCAYMREKYAVYAGTGCDFIWVDDDMRMTWHGVQSPCFCPNCLRKFGSLCGRSFTREELVKALNEDDGSLRRKWITFHSDGMVRLLKSCAKAAREVNPGLRFGLMTVHIDDMATCRLNIEEMLEALDAEMLRPGGGFWTAERPEEYFQKAISVAYQIAFGPSATDVQYESETIPHIYSKPLCIHAMEMTASLMSGCNGIAIDHCELTEPETFRSLLTLLCERRAYWDALTEKMADMRLAGGYAQVDRDACALVKTEKFFPSPGESILCRESRFFAPGFPCTPFPETADYRVLYGHAVDLLDDDALREVLKEAVVLDDVAAKYVTERGFGDLIGIESFHACDNGIRERYTGRPFPEAGGMLRGGAQSQFREAGAMFVPTPAKGAEVLTEVISTTGVYVGAGSMLFENALGGRVAVLAYAPNGIFEQKERIELLRYALRWLAHGELSLDMEGGYRLLPILRKNEVGRFCLMLTNAWLDPSDAAVIRVKSGYRGDLRLYRSSRNAEETLPVKCKDGYCESVLPPLEPWEYAVLRCE